MDSCAKVTQLTTACPQARADSRTALEATAYASHMQAQSLMQRDDWQGAVAQFSAAKQIYERLGSVGTADQRDLFASHVDAIDPSIELCTYNLSLLGEGDGASGAKLMEMREQATDP